MTWRERLASWGIEPLPPEAKLVLYTVFLGFIGMSLLLAAAARLADSAQ
jgi:hypothetical protein